MNMHQESREDGTGAPENKGFEGKIHRNQGGERVVPAIPKTKALKVKYVATKGVECVSQVILSAETKINC